MHAASRASTRRRSRSGARTRTRLAQAASGVCCLGRITYPSGFKALYSRNASGQITGISTQAPNKGTAARPIVQPVLPLIRAHRASA